MKRLEYGVMILMGWLISTVLLTSCSETEEPLTEDTWPTVEAALTFSLPQRIVGETKSTDVTRMGRDVVQASEDVPGFRGLEDLRMLCFEEIPQQNSRKIGKILEFPAVTSASLHGPAKTNYSLYRNLKMPKGASHVAFYARAHNAQRDGSPTQGDLERYGTLSVSGLSSNQYESNEDIRFIPVPICKSAEELGNSQIGQNLLDLLNRLITTEGPEPAPNNSWSTTTNATLQEAYDVMTALTTASSYNVQAILDLIYKALKTIPASETGGQLAALIVQGIADAAYSVPSSQDDMLELRSIYQGFPDDLHLPAGAARIAWNSTNRCFEASVLQDYGKNLQVPAFDRYVYPASLYYQVLSGIVASDKMELSEDLVNDNWGDVIETLYNEASNTVQSSTKSVAVVKQLQYAVGRIDVRATMDMGNYYDAKGQLVDVSNGFTITGYIVGGQHEVDYDFKPVADTKEYYIYDSDLSGMQHISNEWWTDTNYILGLETPSNENVLLALQLVNNGPAFQGADGEILHGATFYLVADLRPQDGDNYSSTLNQIFRKDYVTSINLGVLKGWPDRDGDDVPDPDLDENGTPKPLNGLATATYGLPSLQIPDDAPPTLGLSVDLSWGKGMVFNNVDL